MARYVTQEDYVGNAPALAVFTNSDRVAGYAGLMVAEGDDVAIIQCTDQEIRDLAFDGDPEAFASLTRVHGTRRAYLSR